MENLKGKRMFVKHNYMCLNAQTISKTRKYFSCNKMQVPPMPRNSLLFFRANIYW